MHERRSHSYRSRNYAVSLLALAFAFGAAGCKSGGTAPQDDATLTQSVQGKLSSDSALGSEPIQASVLKGVATLSGNVSSEAARSLAANDTAQVAGIRTVVNNLVVQPSTISTSVAPPVLPPAAPVPPPIRLDKPARRTRPSAEVAPPAPLAAPSQQAESAPIERVTPPAPARTPPPAPAPASRSITLPAETPISIRITETLDSATTQPGDTFSGVLASDIVSDGLVVLPQGTPVGGRVDAVQEAAHFKGSSLLTIELVSLEYGGRRGDRLAITTDSYSKVGTGRGKNSAEKIGGGAAVGAVLGGIFGGGKGAAIGAAAGGGAGAGAQAITKGQQVQIESESVVRFRLTNPVTVRVSTSGQTPRGHDEGDLQRHN